VVNRSSAARGSLDRIFLPRIFYANIMINSELVGLKG